MVLLLMRETEVGRLVRRLREERGWERSILAQKAGVAYASIYDWEARGKIPDKASIRKLAKAFGVGYLRPLMEAAGYPVEEADHVEPSLLDPDIRQTLEWVRSLNPKGKELHRRLLRDLQEVYGLAPSDGSASNESSGPPEEEP